MPRKTATALSFALGLLGTLGIVVANLESGAGRHGIMSAQDAADVEPVSEATARNAIARPERLLVDEPDEESAPEIGPPKPRDGSMNPFPVFTDPTPVATEPKDLDEEPIRVVARVMTPAGQPLTGVRVELLQTPEGIAVSSEASAVEAQYRAFRNHRGIPVQEDVQFTGHDGLATLEVKNLEGALHLRAHHADFDRVVRMLPSEPVPGRIYDLFLRDGATVEAWIYGDLPAPTAEESSSSVTRVVYLHQGPEGRPRARRQATIEQVGVGLYRATLRGVPAGDWGAQVTILVPIRGGRGWKTVARAPKPVSVTPGGHARLEFTLSAIKCTP